MAMKRINNWDKVKPINERAQLPMGGYVCNIMGAEVITCKNGAEMLAVSFDISEGEYKDFYANDYRNQKSEDKRWAGVVRLFVPLDDGSERDEWTKSSFKTFTDAVEDSNEGYHWDWDERTLKGKSIGMITRNEEWEYDGNKGWKVKPFRFVSVDKIKSNKFKLPKDKALNNNSATTSNSAGFSVVDEDDDLPF